MFNFSMIQHPAAIRAKVYVDGPCFDFVLDAWKLDHNNNQVQAATIKFTDLSERELVLLKDEVCKAIQDGLLNKGGENEIGQAVSSQKG